MQFKYIKADSFDDFVPDHSGLSAIAMEYDEKLNKMVYKQVPFTYKLYSETICLGLKPFYKKLISKDQFKKLYDEKISVEFKLMHKDILIIITASIQRFFKRYSALFNEYLNKSTKYSLIKCFIKPLNVHGEKCSIASSIIVNQHIVNMQEIIGKSVSKEFQNEANLMQMEYLVKMLKKNSLICGIKNDTLTCLDDLITNLDKHLRLYVWKFNDYDIMFKKINAFVLNRIITKTALTDRERELILLKLTKLINYKPRFKNRVKIDIKMSINDFRLPRSRVFRCNYANKNNIVLATQPNNSLEDVLES